MHPEGHAAENDTWAITSLSQGFNYEMVCQASGGYGERVDDPAEVPGAIQRALYAVQVEKRQALLNIIGA
jgi:acetolactate synthase-1/2/3 large subunit